MRHPVAAAVAGVSLAILCCGGGTAAALLGGLSGDSSSLTNALGTNCGSVKKVNPDTDLPRVRGLTDEQMRNAAIIIQVGQELKVSPRGWVIAVATALQESSLHNLPHLGGRNDHDSIGLFQQRPSKGWGTPEQLRDPKYASRKFYEKLLTVDGWERMRLTDAAQAVQTSATPDAFQKWEPHATDIVNALTGGGARAAAAANPANLQCAKAGEISAAGWTQPVRGPITSGFRTPERPGHDGVDIGIPKRTVIRATASGVVTLVRCNAHQGGVPYSCDIDGSRHVQGCGWYVEVRHAGSVITRYCHMIQRPVVQVGQQVVAGEPIGLSGTSGNSSGPHLHFEVHLDGDRSAAGAVDPAPFMTQHGAPLGE